MSNFIDRRTFLKNTGLVVLSAAAASALAGCGGGGGAAPASPTLDSRTAQTSANGVSVNMGNFLKASPAEGQYFIYTVLQVNNTMNISEFPVAVSDFSCTVMGKSAEVYSLEKVDSTLAQTLTRNVGHLTPVNIPFYVRVSPEQYQNFENITVTFQKDTSTITFTYDISSIYPQNFA